MKIVKLISNNVKRLSVVEIVPGDGALVTIGGKNGSGKSSVLDSIAYVLGGEKLVPTQPIRKNEAEAKITIDLGDYIVTRRFYREMVEDAPGATDVKHVWGPTRSVLSVTNKEGAKYPSPQVLLDKLYGRLTFDPLAFSREKPATQNEILRRLVNLDFTLVDGHRKAFFDARSMDKKTLAIAERRLADMPSHASAGAYDVDETPLDAVMAEIKAGRDKVKMAEDADKVLAGLRGRSDALKQTREASVVEIFNLERKLAEAKKNLERIDADIHANESERAAQESRVRDAQKQVPDFDALDARVRGMDASNKMARENRVYLEQEHAVKVLRINVDEHTKKIEQIDVDKANALQKAQFPVDGLSLTEEGVTFEGLPLEEVSASVQLRVSIAIGLALNPTLKVLLIRNGNLLDDDGLKMVAAQAEAAGAQVWMEYVTSDAEGVSVMLEDGHRA